MQINIEEAAKKLYFSSLLSGVEGLPPLSISGEQRIRMSSGIQSPSDKPGGLEKHAEERYHAVHDTVLELTKSAIKKEI